VKKWLPPKGQAFHFELALKVHLTRRWDRIVLDRSRQRPVLDVKRSLLSFQRPVPLVTTA
jgi:hypothetical protein